jgi:hypothetical protein
MPLFYRARTICGRDNDRTNGSDPGAMIEESGLGLWHRRNPRKGVISRWAEVSRWLDRSVQIESSGDREDVLGPHAQSKTSAILAGRRMRR